MILFCPNRSSITATLQHRIMTYYTSLVEKECRYNVHVALLKFNLLNSRAFYTFYCLKCNYIIENCNISQILLCGKRCFVDCHRAFKIHSILTKLNWNQLKLKIIYKLYFQLLFCYNVLVDDNWFTSLRINFSKFFCDRKNSWKHNL